MSFSVSLLDASQRQETPPGPSDLQVNVAVLLVVVVAFALFLLARKRRSKRAAVPRAVSGKAVRAGTKRGSRNADVFVSYASVDRPAARRLADALTAEGWSVWWDREIPAGRTFDEVIEDALDSARCIVVLWSKASVSSDWVKTEAAEGARRRILVPALIEDARIPLEFRRLQAADLIGWDGSRTHGGLRSVIDSVARLAR